MRGMVWWCSFVQKKKNIKMNRTTWFGTLLDILYTGNGGRWCCCYRWQIAIDSCATRGLAFKDQTYALTSYPAANVTASFASLCLCLVLCGVCRSCTSFPSVLYISSNKSKHLLHFGGVTTRELTYVCDTWKIYFYLKDIDLVQAYVI